MNRLLYVPLLLALAQSAGAQQKYSFQKFTIPNAEATFATGINNQGIVVGYANTNNPYESPLGFQRLPDGTITNLSWSTAISGINNHAETVGWVSFCSRFCYGYGYYRDASGQTFQLLFSDLPDGAATNPYAINDSGYYVGTHNSSEGNHTFIGRGTTVTEYVIFPGAETTVLQGIAWDGTVVGCYDDKPFLRGPRGRFLALRIPGVTGDACAHGINNAAGKIVGVMGTHGFVYDYASDLNGVQEQVGGTVARVIPVQLVDYPGAIQTQLRGINAKGVIAGWARGTDQTIFGFIATPVP